jgi:hypothetical protein
MQGHSTGQSGVYDVLCRKRAYGVRRFQGKARRTDFADYPEDLLNRRPGLTTWEARAAVGYCRCLIPNNGIWQAEVPETTTVD